MNQHIFVCLCVLIGPVASWNTAAEVANGIQRWEYAELRYYDRVGAKVGAEKEFLSAIHWSSAAGFLKFHGWLGAADELKVPASTKELPKDAAKEVVDAIHRQRVLNHLGSQGWDLTAYDRDSQAGTTTWIFKRKVGQ